MMMECVSAQLEEIEMLEAAFPGPGEFCPDPDWSLAAKGFLKGDLPAPPPLRCRFKLNGFEFTVQLPSEYPKVAPETRAQAANLDRRAETELNCRLTEYISSLPRGEVCLFSAISWLQEQADSFVTNVPPPEPISIPAPSQPKRLWIYSHHIYSTTKRKLMKSLADELRLGGFMVCGKPGIVCIEGDEDDCDQWWNDIKSLNWKKIVVRKTETEFIRQFSRFEDVILRSSDDRHADMGELFRYLSERGCADVFRDFFGFEGKAPS